MHFEVFPLWKSSLPRPPDILRSLSLDPGHVVNKYRAAFFHFRYIVPKEDAESY